MKKLFFYLIISIFIQSCQSSRITTNDSHFNFLLGEWIRTNEKDDRQTFELWKKENDSTYLGCGFTLKNNDTIWQEHTILTKENNIWYFKVKMSKNDQKTTDFKMISFTKDCFTLQKLENNFPKIIKYWKNGNQLNAEIYNDESNKVKFIFEKK